MKVSHALLFLPLGLALGCEEPVVPEVVEPAAVAPPVAEPTPPAPPAPPEPPPEPPPPEPVLEVEPEPEPERAAVANQGQLLPGADGDPIALLKLRLPGLGSRNMTRTRMLRDRLDGTLDINATVGDVNAVLEETGARICGFVRAIPQHVRFCIPEVASEAAAQAFANRLMESRAVVHAGLIFVAGASEITR